MSEPAQKTALVTGAGRGIGRAVVDRLMADGYGVAGCGRSTKPGDWPDAALWVQADVGSSEDVMRLVAAVTEALGPIRVLVNNAGVQIERTVADTTDGEFDLLCGANMRGPFLMSRTVLPSMARTGGAIVNVGSISGHVADPSMAIYNASKSFVHGLTRSIAVDHGPNVRCNAVCPGWVQTAMADEGFGMARDPQAARADALRRHPSGRLVTPEDVARTISWLASDASAPITGTCVTVDGGLTAASPLQPGLF